MKYVLQQFWIVSVRICNLSAEPTRTPQQECWWHSWTQLEKTSTSISGG